MEVLGLDVPKVMDRSDGVGFPRLEEMDHLLCT